MMETLDAGAKSLGLSLNAEQLQQLHVYYQELVEWNKRINLTSITSYEDVQVKHFLDSLSVSLALNTTTPASYRVIDIGTGAGFPGLPLKIALPEIKLVLLEATGKKAVFLQHLREILGLSDVEIIIGRAEEVAHDNEYREKFNTVISRAVAPMVTLVELTLPFCVVGGKTIAQKKGYLETELRLASLAMGVLGGKLRELKPIEVEGLGDHRWLVVIDKVTATPLQYPRRTGVPARKPLIAKQR